MMNVHFNILWLQSPTYFIYIHHSQHLFPVQITLYYFKTEMKK